MRESNWLLKLQFYLLFTIDREIVAFCGATRYVQYSDAEKKNLLRIGITAFLSARVPVEWTYVHTDTYVTRQEPSICSRAQRFSY